jgi:release factor glutamine methyltransferase
MFVKTNTVKAIKDYYYNSLSEIYSHSEITVLIEIVFEHFLNYNKIEVKTKEENRLSESELLLFHFALKRLKNYEPIQYVLEEAPFYGILFKVSSSVLIPRPETEELVELILKQTPNNSRVLDIGTGSGCIPIALKKMNPSLDVFALDISEEALLIAKENAEKNKTSITFFQKDILQCDDLKALVGHKLDVIVSNPPYISALEKTSMDKQVTDFEPHIALFVSNEDPLIFYKKITQLASKNLSDKGQLFFECNQNYGSNVANILRENNFKNVQEIKDINGNVRMIHGYFN